MVENRFLEITISQYHHELIEGHMTIREMVQFYLDRIEAFDQKGPKLNAIIMVNPDALIEADRLDLETRQSGIIRPLQGVPVILKDNVNTVDLPTTAGSKSLEGVIPETDAYIAQRLRAAGAIIIAKSNLHEFAIWGETLSSILGQTLNPYDLTRTPGGSSGGTGAALAANFGLVGIGTDTINSVRSPSSANSLVGIRPTLGYVSRSGIIPYSYTQDTAGPMARTVEDAVRLLEVIRGYDVEDEVTAWGHTHFKVDLKSHLIKEGLTAKRIGILNHFFGKQAVHQEINQAVHQVIQEMSEKGATMVEVNEIIDSDYLVNNVSVHLYDLKDHLNLYLKTLPRSARVHSMAEVLNSGLFHPGIKENLLKASELSTTMPEYSQRILEREKIKQQLMHIMADYDLDALIYPHQKQLTCKVGGSQDERNGVLASVTGFPSICVPAGFSAVTETAKIGVPIGMEILGRPFSEPILVEIAYGLETNGSHRKLPQL
ncbi:amidase family protein [Fusibacter sp. 3D3]|uniref:amidase family protein n=1 Tax=Fusibacter sp. 3D3 TaxID=1048380 RepID=UPI0008575D34|nr:amidase family protein [Fusibacter sp. 3D3]GAU77079.1 aspartyl-tRNA amidotransferase subunit A [Fusibacter sp. 3D3]